MLEAAASAHGDDIQLLTHGATKNWRKLLQVGETLDLNVKRKYLWIWPTEENLNQLKNALGQLKIKRILSIGCGNGLLEWLIKESIDVDVFGLERDRSWWQSKYAVKSFIKLNYIDDAVAASATNINSDENTDFLQQCCQTINWNFALLFCYFNNRNAFLEYLQMFKGNWIVLIGPKPEVEIHTDPSPLNPDFPAEMNWQLRWQFSVGTNDVLAIYANL